MVTSMTTTQTQKFDRMVLECQKAQYALANSRPGSTKSLSADRKIATLVARAEREGFIDEFVRAVNSTTYIA